MKIENLKEVKQYLEYFNIKIIPNIHRLLDKSKVVFSIDDTVYIIKTDRLHYYSISISKFKDEDSDSNRHIYNTIGLTMQIKHITIDSLTPLGSRKNRLSVYYVEDKEDYYTGGVPIGAFSIYYNRQNVQKYDRQIAMLIEGQRKK